MMESDLVIFKDNGNSTLFITAISFVASLDRKADKVVQAAKNEYSKQSSQHEKEAEMGKWEFFSNFKPVPQIGPREILSQVQSGELYEDLPENCFSRNTLDYVRLNPADVDMKMSHIAKDMGGDRRLIAVLTTVYQTAQRETLDACKTREAPSKAAKHSWREKYQVPGNPAVIYDGRPPEFFPTPLSLYNEVFYNFVQALVNPPKPTPKALEHAQQFVEYSLFFYKDEYKRCDRLSPFLNELLGTADTLEQAPLPRREGVGSQGITPMADGLINVRVHDTAKQLGVQRATTLISEAKNEVGEGACNPMMQAQEAYLSLCRQPGYDLLCAKTCAPSFWLAISGDCFSIGGIALADRFISERFTYVAIGPGRNSVNMDNITRRVAQVFTALATCLKQLEAFYAGFSFDTTQKSASSGTRSRSAVPSRQLSQGPSSGGTAHPRFDLSAFPSPRFNQFTTDGADGVITWQLKYHGRLCQPSDAIFRATCSRSVPQPGQKDSHPVVVKFTDRYSKEAHDLLADNSLAPRLWCCERTMDLLVVIMGYIETVDLGAEEKQRKIVLEQVSKGVELLHERNLVHGDLRKPNILVTRKGAMIIDFDWAGKLGETKYPATLNTEIRWPDGVHRDENIAKEHDEKMLEKLKIDWLYL